jgi:hypothetical protein
VPEVHELSTLPLDMVVMLDKSGSMSQPVPGGTRWTASVEAITQFVQQTEVDGTGFGIQYFPLESCDPAVYADPDVDVALLPGVASDVITSMGMQAPTGLTPTSAALEGLLDYATKVQATDLDRVTAAVFVTDGDPTECDTSPLTLETIAETAATADPPIHTYVINVGPPTNASIVIADAGGTEVPYPINTNMAVEPQFLDALNDIHAVAPGCAYVFPNTAQDPDTAVVTLQMMGAPEPEELPRVADAAGCRAEGDGWYYDDPVDPSTIVLCEQICNIVSETDYEEKIDVSLGCTMP